MKKYLPLFQKIRKKTSSFYMVLVLIFASVQGFSQRYFFPSASVSSFELSPGDSLGYSLPGYREFFEHFRTEMELERFLILNLSAYVDPKRFFVSVRFDPEEGADSLSGSLPEELTPGQAPGMQESLVIPTNPGDSRADLFRPPLNRLPVLPNFWDRNKSGGNRSAGESSGEAVGGAQDPGGLGLQNGFYAMQEGFGDQFLLGKLSVHFIIDPEISPEVEGLMGKVSFYALKLYAFESYEITFERIALHDLFPEKPEKTEPDSLVLTVDQHSKIDQLLNTDWQKTFGDWLAPWALLFLLLLLTLLVLLLYALKKKKPLETSKEKENTFLEQSVKEPEIKEPSAEIVAETEPDPVPTKSPGTDNFQDYFVQHTPEIGKVFSYWIEDLGAEGLVRIHTILMPMGKNMYTLLFPYLSKKATELLLKSFYKQLPPVREEDRNTYLEKLFEIINTRLGIDSLALLTSLEKEELFALLDLLQEKDAAKALYHLDIGHRTAYLQRIPPFRAADILMNVTAIGSMSKGDYERLGELISEKLVELRFFRKYQKKDLQFMLESLDSIDLDVQEMILENLKSADPMLYQEIKKFQLSWSDVPGLDEELVREATLGFTSNELSIAYRYGPDQISHIVLLRPERERELILELAKQKREDSEAEAKVISKKLLTAIKTKLQSDEKKN